MTHTNIPKQINSPIQTKKLKLELRFVLLLLCLLFYLIHTRCDLYLKVPKQCPDKGGVFSLAFFTVGFGKFL